MEVIFSGISALVFLRNNTCVAFRTENLSESFDIIRTKILSNDIINLFNSIYSVTSSGPKENVGRIGTNLTNGRTSDPDDVRTTAERATLSEP